jgi:hypothetical protein
MVQVLGTGQMNFAAFTFYELTNHQDDALDIARNSIFVIYVWAI